MDEILKKLLESELLTEETANELQTALKEEFETLRETVREEEATKVKEQLTEQWEGERDSLIEALDASVTDQLKEELAELKSDIDDFRDLEVEYNQRLVNEKAKMAEQLNTDLDKLVESMSDFLEIRISNEIEELKEDIEEVKKLEFGRKVFETFATEFKENFSEDASNVTDVVKYKDQIKQVTAKLEQTQKQLDETKHEQRVNQLTECLKGENKDTMKSILERVPYDRLEETFSKYVGKLLKETAEETVEGEEGKVLTETDSSENAETINENDTVRSGDAELTESEKQALKESEGRADLTWVRQVAGLIK